MRLGWILAICLLWVSTVTFAADKHATAMTASEAPHAEHSADEISAVSGSQGGLWDRVLARVWTAHDQLHGTLAQAIQDLKGKDGIGWSLVLVSFLYGVLHAAGPGHGKAVLTTYLLTHRHRLNRGIAMGTLAALLQGLTALLLVYGLTGLAGWLPQETEWAALWASRIVTHQSPLWALAGGGVGVLGGSLLMLLGLSLLSASFAVRQTLGL